MRLASAYIALVRLPNVLMVAAGVMLGAWWARGSISAAVFAAMVAAMALTAAANSWNDAADIEIDRVAHPERPLPSGLLSKATALGLARFAALLAVVAALLAAPSLALLTVILLVPMRFYSPHIKRLGLPGNLTVALLASLPFLYGAWATGRPRSGLLLVAIAAPLHLAREIAKDLDDAAGDAGVRRTLPMRIGVPGARLILVLALLIFAAAILPVGLQKPAFWAALVPVFFFCAIAVRLTVLGRKGSPRLLKAAMLCAMLAFVVARR
ncbi:MAG: UbiA family prenyltransferase [Anaerolineae bacterium]|nr:UbiA family prenyltransferase [Gemmatimonadaceae bacterium]